MDGNLFLMCEHLNPAAFCDLPLGYSVRTCRRDELDIWKRMPFDTPEDTEAYEGFMTEYFDRVYAKNEHVFFEKCLFVCDRNDVPVGTCFGWRAYRKINTLHWLKVVKAHVGKGIGRALISLVMKDFGETDYPVFLHTQPESLRAIKLYADFGFSLITDAVVGPRHNDLERCLPFLKDNMPVEVFDSLKFAAAPAFFLEAAESSPIDEF